MRCPAPRRDERWVSIVGVLGCGGGSLEFTVVHQRSAKLRLAIAENWVPAAFNVHRLRPLTRQFGRIVRQTVWGKSIECWR